MTFNSSVYAAKTASAMNHLEKSLYTIAKTEISVYASENLTALLKDHNDDIQTILAMKWKEQQIIFQKCLSSDKFQDCVKDEEFNQYTYEKLKSELEVIFLESDVATVKDRYMKLVSLKRGSI